MMMIVIIIMIIMMIVKIIRLKMSDDMDELLGPIFDEVPNPTTQEEIVHEPKIIQQVPIPTTQVEIVHEPTIIQQNQGEIVYMQMICLPVAPKTRVFLHQHFGQVLPTTRYKTMWAPKYS